MQWLHVAAIQDILYEFCRYFEQSMLDNVFIDQLFWQAVCINPNFNYIDQNTKTLD